MQAYSTATQDVEVTLHSYSNPTHQDCNGDHCEGLPGGNCDNFFDFCLREVGGSSCLTPNITTGYIEEDVFTFGESELNQLEIDNPLKFSSISSSVRFICMLQYYCVHCLWRTLSLSLSILNRVSWS